MRGTRSRGWSCAICGIKEEQEILEPQEGLCDTCYPAIKLFCRTFPNKNMQASAILWIESHAYGFFS